MLDCGALLAGSLITLLMSVSYHISTVRRLEKNSESWLTLGLAYSLGQIVRYLPGKILGVVFQVSYLKGRIRGSTVTIALISQAIYDSLWALVFSASILSIVYYEMLWPALISAIFLLIASRSHQRAWVERGLLMPRITRPTLTSEQRLYIDRNHPTLIPTLNLALIWIPFFLGIIFFLSGTSSISESVVLAACYLFAAIASMLVIVVPSGIVLREALFIFFGSQLGVDTSTLLTMGIALRISLTIAELGCAAIFYVLSLLLKPDEIPLPQPESRLATKSIDE